MGFAFWLKVAGIEVASMGCSEPERPDDDVFQILEERKSTYRKIIVREGRLIGALLVGNASAAGTLVQHFDRGDPMPEDPLEALCQAPAAGSAERVVCNCNKVTDTAIKEAIYSHPTLAESLNNLFMTLDD